MTNAEMIRQNARDTVAVIDTMNTLLTKFASDNCELQQRLEQQMNLNKEASAAPAPVFTDKLMKRAAAAVCDSYGSNPSLTPEVLEAVWRNKPDTLLENICKMASDLASAAISGDHIGVNVPKKSEETTGMKFGSDHQALFNSSYNQ
jgi:hypothetical protein